VGGGCTMRLTRFSILLGHVGRGSASGSVTGKHRVPISSGPAPGVYGASGPAPVCKGPCRQSKIHVGGGRGWSTALSKALGAGAAGAGRFSRIFWSVYRFLVVSLLFISYLPPPCIIFIKVASTFAPWICMMPGA